MRIHWHRRDLRVADNLGLVGSGTEGTGADEHGPGSEGGETGTAGTTGTGTLPVFVFDDSVLAHAGPPRVRFLLDAVGDLREAYRDRGGDLLVTSGDPSAVLPDLVAEYGADRVTWSRDYSGLARERDEAVRAALEDLGVAVDSVHDAVLHPPGSITTNEGDPYAVFTYFGRKWHDREADEPVAAPDGGDFERPASTEPVPDLEDLGVESPAAEVPAGTRAAGLDRLARFCEGPIYRYGERRDFPAAEDTSRLSPHLKFGTLGIREVYAATRQAMDQASERLPDVDDPAPATVEAARESVEEYQSQLAWREFYTQVLWANPETVSEDYREYPEPIEWADDPEGLDAWRAGETGFPIVDAGMRQLRAEAWMHNRVRMIVASFLTKDLRIDWRAGYDWFRRRLVDHDTANDVGGWQWAASTGTDAQPYFRIFNPTTQGERYDPEGTYVQRYVSELEGVPADAIHGWTELAEAEREAHAPDYPAPIVDHAERREAALEMFERARGE